MLGSWSKVLLIIKQEEIPFSECDAILGFSNIEFEQKYIKVEFEVEEQNIPEQIIVGPKIDSPQVAVEGFYKKYLQYEIDKSGANYIAKKPAQHLNITEVAVDTVETLIEGISVSWKETLKICPLPWVRPIHSISAFLDAEPLQHQYTYNPLPFQEAKKIEIPHNSKFLIEEEITRIEKEDGVTCVSQKSVTELAWLYEYPQFQIAEIPQEYLALPKEVLNLTITQNQRYILFEKEYKIASKFLIVGNKHNGVILKGHLKTLRARLGDAQYYIEKDIKTFAIDQISSLLESIAFHQKYGSVAKRVRAMHQLAQECFPNDDLLLKAVLVCKNDLVSNTVQSFTQLQGYCGGYYLRKLGVQEKIATAVVEHYKPLSPKDQLPSSLLGRKLSLIEKLQKINTLAEVGEIPTSSRDPFAIRRDILSIIRICVEEKFNISASLIHESLQKFVKERVKLFVKEYTDFSPEEVLKKFEIHQNLGILLNSSK